MALNRHKFFKSLSMALFLYKKHQNMIFGVFGKIFFIQGNILDN